MKTRNTLTIITLIALLALTVEVGGGTAEVHATDLARMTSGAASSVRLPIGVYTTTITLADIPPDFPPEAAAILVGEWQTEFTEAGTTVVTRDGEIAVLGHYTAGSTHLVMTDLQGALACTDEPGIATGIYNWSLVNDQLVLTAVRDRCVGRQFVLTAHPLEKQ